MRKVAVLLTAVVVALGFAPRAGAATYLVADENQSQALVNGARQDGGLQGLPSQADLQRMARGQAVRMAERGEIYHNPNMSGEADAAGLKWRRLGENVGVGPDVESIHDAFMASPHHHENLMHSTYNAIGVGVVPGDDGRVYVAHVFAELESAPAAPAVQQPAPAAPASAPAQVAPVATSPSAPTATPTAPSPDPNALVGGVVNLEVVFGTEPVPAGADPVLASLHADDTAAVT